MEKELLEQLTLKGKLWNWEFKLKKKPKVCKIEFQLDFQ